MTDTPPTDDPAGDDVVATVPLAPVQTELDDPDASTSKAGATANTPAGAMEKASESTQLSNRNVTQTISGGLKPPYNPAELASFLELNGTHAIAVAKKAQWEVGFGVDIEPHERVSERAEEAAEDAAAEGEGEAEADEDGDGTPDAFEPDEDQRQRAREFWFGDDSHWTAGPRGTAPASPQKVCTLARQDYHGIGWAALEIIVDGVGYPIGLSHVPATTVRVRKDEDSDGNDVRGHGYVQEMGQDTVYFAEAGDRYGDEPTFVDRYTGDVVDDIREIETEPANELIYDPNPSPLSLYYGIPNWVPEIQTMAADEAVKEYNFEFFEHGTIPQLAVLVKNGELNESSRKSLRELVHDFKGKPHRTAILEAQKLVDANILTADGERAEVEIELQPLTVQQDNDMAFTTYRERNEHDIAKVHSVPSVLINRTESSNRANSREMVRAFALEEVAPEQEAFAERLYRSLHVNTPLDCPDWTPSFELRGAENDQRDAEVAATKFKAGREIYQVDEARELFGLDPLGPPIGEMLVSEFSSGGNSLDDQVNEIAEGAAEEAVGEAVPDEDEEDEEERTERRLDAGRGETAEPVAWSQFSQ